MAFPESAVLPQAKARRPARPDPEGPDRTRSAGQIRKGREGRGRHAPGWGRANALRLREAARAGGVRRVPRSRSPRSPRRPFPCSSVLARPCASLCVLVRLAGKATRQERRAGKRIPVRVLFSALFPRPGTAPMPHAQRTLVRSARLPWRPGRTKARPSGRRQGKPGPEGADSCR